MSASFRFLYSPWVFYCWRLARSSSTLFALCLLLCSPSVFLWTPFIGRLGSVLVSMATPLCVWVGSYCVLWVPFRFLLRHVCFLLSPCFFLLGTLIFYCVCPKVTPGLPLDCLFRFLLCSLWLSSGPSCFFWVHLFSIGVRLEFLMSAPSLAGARFVAENQRAIENNRHLSGMA